MVSPTWLCKEHDYTKWIANLFLNKGDQYSSVFNKLKPIES